LCNCVKVHLVTIRPNADQFAALVNAPDDGPVVMVNLLKFKAEQAYERYGSAATSMVKERGGRLLWLGRVDQVLIGDVDADAWDAVALVEYPSREAFIDMVSTREYQAAHTHREEGLERTVVLATVARDPRPV
jgi:uncharacterized protein (DUF1330 family)